MCWISQLSHRDIPMAGNVSTVVNGHCAQGGNVRWWDICQDFGITWSNEISGEVTGYPSGGQTARDGGYLGDRDILGGGGISSRSINRSVTG